MSMSKLVLELSINSLSHDKKSTITANADSSTLHDMAVFTAGSCRRSALVERAQQLTAATQKNFVKDALCERHWT